MSAPLAGVRILDLTHFVAGPWCTMMLADLGAEVIKVEPAQGEIGRHMGGVYAEGESAIFLGFNRNKRSVALDLKTEAGSEVAAKLAANTDVIVHNFRPGVAERLGLGATELLERSPRLIYCAISAFGADGPYAAQPANDPIIQGLAGSLLPEPGPSVTPIRLGVSLPDFAAGGLAAIGILAAVLRRDTTGAGGLVETNLLEAQLFAQVDRLQGVMLTAHRHEAGEDVLPVSAAVGYPTVFRCADRDHLYVAASTLPELNTVAAALGIPVDGDDRATQFSIASRFATLTVDEAHALLDGVGIANARVASLTEGFAAARHLVRQLMHPKNDALSGLALPIVSAPPWPERLQPPPGLGEHTREVLRELGITNRAIDGLVRDGVARCGPVAEPAVPQASSRLPTTYRKE